MTALGAMAQLQVAYVAKIRTDSGIKTLCGDPVRLFEDVSPDAVFPYISLGEDQEIPRLSDCINGSEIIVTMHTWSRKGGYGEIKSVSDAINTCLHDADYFLDDFTVKVFQRNGYRAFKDPDGLTTHGVLNFRALVTPR